MHNSEAIDGTYYKTTSDELIENTNHKDLLPLQEQVFKYIRMNHIVSGKSIRLYCFIDLNDMHQIIQPLFDQELVRKVLTQKQVEELQVSEPQEMVITEAEERRIRMQEKVVEIQSLDVEYSRKRRELNRIYEKQEKTRQELSDLTKADYQFYHGGK